MRIPFIISFVIDIVSKRAKVQKGRGSSVGPWRATITPAAAPCRGTGSQYSLVRCALGSEPSSAWPRGKGEVLEGKLTDLTNL